MTECSVVSWNAQALVHSNIVKRDAKLSILKPYLAKRSLIAIQETHGTSQMIHSLVNSTGAKYDVYHSGIPDSNAAGGVAFLIPKFVTSSDQDNAKPLINFSVVIPGRVAEPRIRDPSLKYLHIYLNIHNHDLSADDRRRIKATWQVALNEASSDPEHVMFFMLGDFNISELPARSLLRPVEVPAHER